MDRRPYVRLAAWVLAACAGGCAPNSFLRHDPARRPEPPSAFASTKSDKSKPPTVDDRSTDPAADAGQGAPGPRLDPRGDGMPLPPEEFGRAKPVPGCAPAGVFPVKHEGEFPPKGSELLPPPAPLVPDPHLRMTPTAAGCLLNLGPGDNATERAVELAKRLEICAADNRMLLARIKTLESLAEGREAALAETLRDAEAASAEVSRTRQELESLRKEISKLRERLKQIEKEDVETLRAMIGALEKLLEPKGPAP